MTTIIISISSICSTVKMMLMVLMMMITMIIILMTMMILANAYDRLILAKEDKKAHRTVSDVIIIKLRCSHQTLQNDEMRRKTPVALLLNVRVARLNDTSAAGHCLLTVTSQAAA